jgi:hypothetical protein
MASRKWGQALLSIKGSSRQSFREVSETILGLKSQVKRGVSLRRKNAPMRTGPVARSWPERGAQGNPAQRAPQASERANPDGGGDATADRPGRLNTTDTDGFHSISSEPRYWVLRGKYGVVGEIEHVGGKDKDRRYIPIELGRRGRLSKEGFTGPFYLRYGAKYEHVGMATMTKSNRRVTETRCERDIPGSPIKASPMLHPVLGAHVPGVCSSPFRSRIPL